MPVKKQAKRTKAPKGFTTAEVAQLLHQIPEIAEMFSQADLQLAIDDRGWVSGVPMQLSTMTPQQRQVMLTKCRVYRRDDPLAKQAVRLWTDYALGDTGACYEIEEDSQPDAAKPDDVKEAAAPPAAPPKPGVPKPATDPNAAGASADAPLSPATQAAQDSLDAFWNHPRNKVFTSAAGQQRLSKKLLTDGDLFFAFFDVGETKILRLLKPEDIKIITDPDDEERTLAYKRTTKNNEHFFYRDATLAIDDELYDDIIDPDTKQAIAASAWEDAIVYHVPFDQVDGPWGNSLLGAAVDWSKEHRRFMTARIALLEALAKIAWKQTVKGGKATLNSLGASMQSTLASQGLVNGEKNPVIAPGSTRLQNSATDLTPMPRTTGAGDAKTDSDIIKLLVCSGTGIMQHYFGDPSTGNLATATAMELPMLKQFQAYQQLWKDIWRTIFSVVLDEIQDYKKPPAEIEISLPPILDEDLQKLGSFLSTLTTVFPEAKVDAVLGLCLKFLGIEDVDQVMDSIEDKRDELDQKAKEQAALMAKNPQFVQGVPTNPNAPKPADQAKVIEALEKLIESLNRPVAARPVVIEAAPPNVNLTVENHPAPKAGKTTRRGKATRSKNGDINIEMEDVNNG